MPTFPYIYNSALYGNIFNVSITCWWLFELWVFWRDRKKASGTKTDQGSRIFLIAIMFLGIFLGFTFLSTAPGFGIYNYYPIAFTIGIVFVWAGIFFRFWAVQTLGKYFRTSVFIQKDHKIITTGPYRYLRNPSYTGSFVTVFGLGLAMGNWLSILAMTLCVFIGYVYRIRIEQKTLVGHFGKEYKEYMKKTWALIPFVW